MRRVPGPLAGETHHSTPVGLAYSVEDAPVLLLRPGSLPGLLEEEMDDGGAAPVTSLPSRSLDHDARARGLWRSIIHKVFSVQREG